MRGRTIAWILGILLGLILIVTLFIGISAWRSLPETSGNLYFPGLDGSVDIYRDQLGIPHIFATTDHRRCKECRELRSEIGSNSADEALQLTIPSLKRQ